MKVVLNSLEMEVDNEDLLYGNKQEWYDQIYHRFDTMVLNHSKNK